MIFATNGAKLYIGGAIQIPRADLTAISFSGQAWLQISETESLGQIGDTSTEIPFESIDDERTRRLKGTRSAGTMEVVCGIDYSDPGQIALLVAEKQRFDYAFRLVLNDAPPGGTPSERLFAAAVGSASEALDTANNVMKLNASLWVNSNVVRINAAGAGAAPDNTALPSITGTAEVGETLTAAPGTWAGSAPINYGYQWFAGGETIPGANANTYVPVSGDVGKAISVMVTAMNTVGTRQAISAATATVDA